MGSKTMKKYSAQEKFAAVFESYATGDVTGTAARHSIHINMSSTQLFRRHYGMILIERLSFFKRRHFEN